MSNRPATLSLRLFLLLAVLSLSVPARALPQTDADDAVRTKDRGEIHFPRGGNSTRVRGRVPARVRDQYLIGARAGQVMTINLQSDDPQTGFDVYATTGLEASPVTAVDELQTRWSGRLPEASEYYINVRTKGAGGAYSFEVKIENAGAHRTGALPADPKAIAGELRATVERIREHAGAPILLPEELPASVTRRPVYIEGAGEKNGYTITLSSRPRCGANSCFVGFLSAARGETRTEEFDSVELAHGIAGAYKPLTCGASCSPPMIEWEYAGALYTIQLSIETGSEERDKQTMVELANSAINAGPR